MITRSLAADSSDLPTMNTRMAVNALRYQLDHPLTSHDDSQIYPAHSQQPTQAYIQRQRPRRPLPSRKDSPSRRHFTNGSSQRVDDALTELSLQVSNTWDRRPYGAEQGVDIALDSLITTANKLNLTYNSPPQGSGHFRRA
ncbi:uncharacterized protein PITG_02535 [Phytophthora infestans T30-4]|uniref:Uncharacterized protein n=1 Tax=Phytophthora infestans (strain T30-4) TaxID=403677 RepID=D0MWK5_PHYIT|nr:uncharacterized protein PITG_02535 [Phytophthora infestans T30-4]EEY64018.1 hypothetical protein PITG_02535 [Phytophthora infestans T30-4]|eukprot:XP_002907454.1 hypothetical protein PITG_02535 [Phytophthora infestans T30-4]